LDGPASNLKVLLEAGASGGYEIKGRHVTVRPGTIFDAAATERIKKRAEGINALMNAAPAAAHACASCWITAPTPKLGPMPG
jgi:hypothetical protein